MDFLKSIFEDKALTYAELEEKLKDNKEIKLANLASGQYVDKEKFERAETKSKEFETQLTAANETIKSFKDLDVEGLKKGVADWEQKYNDDTKALNDKLINQTKSSKIEIALLAAKAKNTKAVKALLDEEKISLDGENLIGVNEQLEAIKKDNAYLFDDGRLPNPPPPFGGNPQETTSLDTQDMGAYLEARKKL